MKDRKCDQDAWIVSSSEVVVVFFTVHEIKSFVSYLHNLKTIVMERIRKPLHYILVVYTRVLYGHIFIDIRALAFGFMTGGPKMWLAHLSYSQK